MEARSASASSSAFAGNAASAISSHDTRQVQTDFAQLLTQFEDPQVSGQLSVTSQRAEVKPDPLQQAFQDFVGQTFFGEMIKSYRRTQQPSAYFHGGQAEKIFQSQLDQLLSESISQRSADKVAQPMFDLFMARRPS